MARGWARSPRWWCSPAVVLILHHQLAQLHVKSIFAHLHAIPRRQLLAALGFTALSYWLLSTYEVLALRYLRRLLPYTRIVFTSFIANAFGHTLGSPPSLAPRSASACMRPRASPPSMWRPLRPSPVCRSASAWRPPRRCRCCSRPSTPPRCCTCITHWPLLIGSLLLAAVGAYALWACLARGALEIRGWALRAPGPAIGPRRSCCRCSTWRCLRRCCGRCCRRAPHIGFVTFLGVYAAAVIAGIVSHVPGGVGVFEAVIAVHAAQRARGCAARVAACLPRRVLPGAAGVRHAAVRLQGARARSAAASPGRRSWPRLYIAPVVPQVAGAPHLPRRGTAAVLRRDPGASTRAWPSSPVPAARGAGSSRTSPAASSGWRCSCWRARCSAACRPPITSTVWLLVAGIFASLLKGLDFEEASLLVARARRADARAARLLPPHRASCRALHARLGRQHRRRDRHGVWIGLSAYRHVEYSRRSVVDVRVGCQRAAHAARLARGGRARRAPTCC